MVKRKNKVITAKAVGKYLEGKSVSMIAKEIGTSRTTVSAHLNSPEVNGMFQEVNRGLAEMINDVLGTVKANMRIDDKDSDMVKLRKLDIMSRMLSSLGGKMIQATPTTTISEHMVATRPGDRDLMIGELKELLSGKDKDTKTITVPREEGLPVQETQGEYEDSVETSEEAEAAEVQNADICLKEDLNG